MSTASEVLWGRGLPSAVDIERMLLGAIMTQPVVASSLLSRLSPSDFTLESHRRLFAIMGELSQSGVRISRLILADKLFITNQLEAVGGLSFLVDLDKDVPGFEDYSEYVETVKEKSRLRQIIFGSQAAIDRALLNKENSRDIIASMGATLSTVLDDGVDDKPQLLKEYIDTYPGGIGALLDPSLSDAGIPSGLASLDELTGGFHQAEIVIVGARPSQGKTSLLTTVAENVASTGKHVVIFSMEMPKRRLFERMISGRARIGLGRFRRGDLNPEDRKKIQFAMADVYNMRLSIDDTTGLTVADLGMRLKAIHEKNPVALCCVDFVQLMRPRSYRGSRDEQVSGICQDLQALAKQTGIPLFLASQLSRESDKRMVRGKKEYRPQLSDLRESGSWEQIANVVIMIYREYMQDVTRGDLKDKAELCVVKNRDGELGNLTVRFQGWLFKFDDAPRVDTSDRDIEL